TFTISAKDGAFEAGATYKITLDDERLQFDGYGASVRDYNFTTAKDETLALSLGKDLIYVPASDVTNMTQDGSRVSSLNVPVATVGENLSAVNLENGTFVYTKGTLKIDDTVAIYEGIQPNKRTFDNENDGNVAYVTITNVNGNTYSYKNADSEKVLFTPDILPVNTTADTDGNATNHSITVPKSVMDFSNDIYTKVDLDSQTSVDIGDFIAFYSGNFGQDATDLSYAKIISVNLHDTTYTITYADTTSDDVIAAMDLYNSENIDGETLLAGTDVKALEQSVEQQARDSGFADEAAQYLAEMALKTESFTTLSEDMKLDNVTFEKQDGTPLSNDEIALMNNNKVHIRKLDLNAEVGTKLKHFDNVSGVRLLLKVGVEVAVDINENSELIINVTGEFEQETRVALNISGGAVWSMWTIFPYISEYEATANIDLYDYTGIEVDATIVTKEKKTGLELDGSIKNISEELKKLLDGNDGYVGDGKGTVIDGISAKYQAMLQNDSEWIQLFSQDICRTNGAIDPFHVLAYEFGLSFVVSANLNISLGIDFYYQNAKRYTYTVAVFAKSVTSDVIDVLEEQYEFTFYVMGVLGVRAGILLEAKIGLFDTDLDSVGFTAEAGAYFKVWGYFYYNLKYTASLGRSSGYAGALLLEVGLYLEIKFEAQAFSGTFSYNPTLYEHEWPLWHAGTQKNVQDFSYLPPDTPEITMKKFVQTVGISDNLFGMKYLDLKEGDIGSSIYDDSKDFGVEMTNKAFAYDPVTNYVSVTTGDAKELDGEMIIRWKSQPLAFTSAPLTRTIKLHWDKLNDGYYIAFNTNGGSAVDMIVSKYGQNIAIPNAPTRHGYVFGGWYTDEEFTQPYTIPSTMPDVDTLAYAKWNPATDTKYTVEHYKQNLQNILYEPIEIEKLTGTTDSAVTPERKAYEGFTTPKEEEIIIKADGSAVVRYYYSRAKYSLTFKDDGEEITTNVRYGERITAPIIAKNGYDFAGWDNAVEAVMPAHNLTYNAQWTAKTVADIPYRVEHYLQNAEDDGYTLHQIDKLTGATEAMITPAMAMLTDKLPVGFVYNNATVNGTEAVSAVVSGDGKLVFKLYYIRNVHDLSFVLNETADSDMPTTTPYRYDKIVIEPNMPVKEGYKFIAWYTDESMKNPAEFGTLKMPNTPTTLYGKMELDLEAGFAIDYIGLNGATNTNKTRYTVGDADFTLVEPGERLGYTFEGWYKDSGHVNKVEGVAIPTNSIGQKKFYAKWNTVNYTITYNNIDNSIEGAENNNPAVYQITSSNITLNDPKKPGYTFDGWYTDDTLQAPVTGIAIATGSAGNKTFYAKWTANTYTVAFNSNASTGTGTMTPLECTYDVENVLTTNTFERIGYTFKSWNTKADGNGKEYLNGASVKNLATSGVTILYAMWTPVEYTVSYELNGGINNSGNITKYTIESPAFDPKTPTKTGYTFVDWYMDSGFNNPIARPAIPLGNTGDMKFYAKWEINKYKVQLLPYGDNITGSMSDMSFKYGETKTLTANQFARTGYSFAGWSQRAGGSVAYSDSQSVSNLTTTNNGTVTLYPVWREHTYTLTFSNGGALNPDGTFWTTKTVKYGDNITIPGAGIVNGWNYNGAVLTPGQSGVYGLTATNGGTVTLTPDWKVGSGTASDPYLIHDRAGMEAIGNRQSAYHKMIADVNLGSWTPICS
ncbi:MAG: InlB B-repeat-containing protein, partial [Oscillospiraceae bacterium]